MTRIVLVVLSHILFLSSSQAQNQNGRFIEFSDDNETITYDLTTVQIVQPGRFTVISTTISTSEIIKLKVKVLDVLHSYCSKSDGQYEAPKDIFTLGNPDMPIKPIEVKTRKSGTADKFVLWHLPYARLALHRQSGIEQAIEFFDCDDGRKSKAQLYLEARAYITNGAQTKILFDCRRGLMGHFIGENKEPSKAITRPVSSGLERAYLALCLRVTNQTPVLPN